MRRLVAVLVFVCACFGASANRAVASTNQPLRVLPLARVFEQRGSNGLSLSTEPAGTNSGGYAFRAVVTNVWPAGLVPVFQLEKDGAPVLRRLPPRGLENVTDPLFFALPNVDEPALATIAGRWTCISTNDQSSRQWFEWELTGSGERLAGRFAPESEYRVAFITGGNFRSPRFELNVEYHQDRYRLAAILTNGVLAGTYQQEDGPDRGAWVAERHSAPVLPQAEPVPLFEWTNRTNNTRRYLLAGERPGSGWTRAERPLCRVWR